MGTCVTESVHCAPCIPPKGVVHLLGGGRDSLDLGGFLWVPHANPSALCRGQVCQGTLQTHSHRAALKWRAQNLQWMGLQVCLACSCLLAQLCVKLHSLDAHESQKTSGLARFSCLSWPLMPTESTRRACLWYASWTRMGSPMSLAQGGTAGNRKPLRVAVLHEPFLPGARSVRSISRIACAAAGSRQILSRSHGT